MSVEERCEHDIQPIHTGADWGRCVKCGESGYPMTMRAAYGDVQCEVCNDTGMVPVWMTTLDRVVFADAQCPACPRYGIEVEEGG